MPHVHRPRRRTAISIFAALGALITILFAVPAAGASGGHNPPAKPKPTIVLVHGAWADGSSWSKVTERLQHDGYTVLVPPNPLRSLSGDAAYLSAFIQQRTTGPVVLVGHSYGGAVITNAATGNPNVKALVYINGFAPNTGENVLQLSGERPGSDLAVADPTTVFDFVQYPGAPTGDFDLYLKASVFPRSFAADLPRDTANELAASQRPLTLSAGSEPSGTPAWATIPSWYLVGTADRVIPPAEQVFMAQRAHAQITKVNASHLSMLSHPADVERVIVDAAR
jgi:pimeloyl-ACP methyl ester carboxylesterase